MKLAFAGSPAFAVPSLERLAATEHEIACVITQPDRAAGRGLKLRPPPVKQFAQERGLTVYQPEKFNSRSFLDMLEGIGLDIIIVVAYGKIFRRRSLNLPKRGCINLHASLLPKYRGVAPINWTIINGETESGVTTFFMDEGIDTGDVILSRRTLIGEDENAGELSERLAAIGAELLAETCDIIAAGTANPAKQDESMASYAPKLAKEDGLISWDKPARGVHNLIRGVNPWPGAFAMLKDRHVKIMESAYCEREGEVPGRILEIDSQSGILVSCRPGSVWLKILQAEGRRAVGGADFTRGQRLKVGDLFD